MPRFAALPLSTTHPGGMPSQCLAPPLFPWIDKTPCLFPIACRYHYAPLLVQSKSRWIHVAAYIILKMMIMPALILSLVSGNSTWQDGDVGFPAITSKEKEEVWLPLSFYCCWL